MKQRDSMHDDIEHDEQDDVGIAFTPEGEDMTKPAVLSTPTGMLVFPYGLQAFCADNSIELLSVELDGEILFVEEGGTEWETYPRVAQAPVSVVSIVKKAH